MADYISREDLINHLAICKNGTDITNLAWATITAIECYIRDMPAADVIEVVHGRGLTTAYRVPCFEDAPCAVLLVGQVAFSTAPTAARRWMEV